MKHNILKLFLCLMLALSLVLCICACDSDDATDSSSNTETSTDTASDSSTDTGSEQAYTVKFYVNGELNSTQSIISGGVASVPSVTKDGYTVVWKNGSDAWDFSTPITENLTLSAEFVPNEVKIKFNANGAFGEMAEQTAYANSTVTLSACTFGKPGYTFRGWSTTANGAVYFLDEDSYVVGTESEYELFAIWKANSNTLFLHSNLPEAQTPIEVSVKSGEEYILSYAPERKYYKFIGWSKTPNGAVDYEQNGTYKMGTNASYNLYAVWELDLPTAYDIDVIKDGASEYSIVYTRGSTVEEEFANALAAYVSDTYGVTIECYDNRYAEKDKEIIIGNARDISKVAASTINAYNDFTISVFTNDLVIYAPNEYLYDYMLEIAKVEVFKAGSTLTVKANGGFVYSDSDYKSINYAQYLKQKNGNFDYSKLLNIFEERVFVAQDGTNLLYRIYVPSSYNSESGNPVVTILHGAGERGSDNDSQLKNMVAKLFNQENSPYLNSIIIAPQCPDGNQWVDWPWSNGNYSTDSVSESNELKAAYELISGLKYEMTTDESRYYIMGLSMGGFGTWDMIARHGELFAAAVPICGGGDPSKASYLAAIPIYTVHGTADPSVPHAGTQGMYDAIIAQGGTLIRFDSLQNANHFVWDYVGDSTEIAAWLFSQTK